nr:hypothetical protein [Armatimonadota bacterium]
SHFSPAPKVDGEVIDPQNEPGPWFALLRRELPVMEREIEQWKSSQHAAKEEARRSSADRRAAELDAARSACRLEWETT